MPPVCSCRCLRELILLACLATVASASAVCTASPDSPQYLRWGDDVASIPLYGENATLAYCTSLCCTSPICVAYSFNYPQPVRSCIGGSCCEVNGTCCMLKNGEGLPLQPTPYPIGVCVSGNVSAKATPSPSPSAPPHRPGPNPPFPPSTLITSVTFGEPRFWGGQGDTWPSAWAADGHTYAWDCDASNGGKPFSPMSLWQLDGDPNAGGLTPTPIENEAINYEVLCAALGPTGQYPHINVKPAGMTALPDGSLIVGVSCINYGDDKVFNRQHNLQGFIARSTDFGATWANVSVVGDVFTGRLAAPVFVSCGRANDGDCLADGVLYVFFPGSENDESYWDNNDSMFLGRVPPASIDNASSYEFFTGFDGSGAPTWSTDTSQAQPSLAFGRMVGENAVSWHPGLKRYLIVNYGFIDNGGTPRPWHSEPFMSPHRTQLTIFEAPHAWGPWSLAYRDDDSAGLAPGLYTPTFPSQWMRPLAPGATTAELTMLFACLGGAASCRYTLNWVAVNLTLAAGVV